MLSALRQFGGFTLNYLHKKTKSAKSKDLGVSDLKLCSRNDLLRQSWKLLVNTDPHKYLNDKRGIVQRRAIKLVAAFSLTPPLSCDIIRQSCIQQQGGFTLAARFFPLLLFFRPSTRLYLSAATQCRSQSSVGVQHVLT